MAERQKNILVKPNFLIFLSILSTFLVNRVSHIFPKNLANFSQVFGLTILMLKTL